MAYYLESEEIYFRKLEITDVNDDYYQWLNDREITYFLDFKNKPVGKSDMISYVESINDDAGVQFFAICLKANKVHIGNMKIWNIDYVARNALISVLIGSKSFQNKGFGTQAISLICQYANNYLNLKKISATIASENVASLKSFKKNGFEEEGLLKNQLFLNGNYQDQIILSKNLEQE